MLKKCCMLINVYIYITLIIWLFISIISESPEPLPFFYAIAHAGFIKGETTNFEIDPSIGLEASQIYPDVKYNTVEQYLELL